VRVEQADSQAADGVRGPATIRNVLLAVLGAVVLVLLPSYRHGLDALSRPAPSSGATGTTSAGPPPQPVLLTGLIVVVLLAAKLYTAPAPVASED
jgi:hypothetical protein